MEEKHLIQISRNLRGIRVDFLVDFYNQYSGLKPLGPLQNRSTIEGKVGTLIKAMLKEKRDAKKKALRGIK